MVYVKKVNIVTLMASLGVIKKRIYAIRKLKWRNPKKSWADLFSSLLELHQLENLLKTIKKILLLL